MLEWLTRTVATGSTSAFSVTRMVMIVYGRHDGIRLVICNGEVVSMLDVDGIADESFLIEDEWLPPKVRLVAPRRRSRSAPGFFLRRDEGGGSQARRRGRAARHNQFRRRPGHADGVRYRPRQDGAQRELLPRFVAPAERDALAERSGGIIS